MSLLQLWRKQSETVFPIKLKTASHVVRTDAVTMLGKCELFHGLEGLLVPGVEIPIAVPVDACVVDEGVGSWYGQALTSTTPEELTALLRFADYMKCDYLALCIFHKVWDMKHISMQQLWRAASGLDASGCLRRKVLETLCDITSNVESMMDGVPDPHNDIAVALSSPLHVSFVHWTGQQYLPVTS